MKAFKQWLTNNKHAYLLLYLPVYLAGFFFVESQIVTEYTPMYWPFFDDLIKFNEYWIIPYLLWAPLMALVGGIIFFKDVPAFKRYAYRVMIGFTFSILFFFIFPNGQNLRPTEFARDNIFTHWIKLTYEIDTNTNVFPSVHVMGSIFMAQCFFDSECLKKYRWLGALAAALISISTCFVKQHSFADVVFGFVCCIPIYFIVDVVIKKRMEDAGASPSPARAGNCNPTSNG